jgi:endonuclease-3
MHSATPADPAARLAAVLAQLEALYPDATTELAFRSPFELLVATILSAQCTDEMVNRVTPELFRRYPTPQALAAADPGAIAELIKSTGFFRQKTKSIVGTSHGLATRFGGEVPRTMAALTSLPGVARKTANVVLGTAYGIAAGVVVDTHVRRVAQRLDLTAHDTPEEIETDLMARVPQDRWIVFAHHLILHGRRVCTARKPACDRCPLASHCPASGTF